LDARSHDRREHTGIDDVLECAAGTAVELDGERMAVGSAGAVLNRPGMRHRAAGRMTIPNIVVPPFDPADESFDPGQNVRCSGHTGPAARPDREPARKSSQLTQDLVTPW
jgi:hypothetical protein